MQLTAPLVPPFTLPFMDDMNRVLNVASVSLAAPIQLNAQASIQGPLNATIEIQAAPEEE